MHRLHLSIAGALTLTLAAGAAGADDRSAAGKAAALFEEGRRLMAAENYAAACPKLAESQALAPAADTAFDLGICYQRASQAAFKAARDLAHAPDRVDDAVAPPLVASVPEEREAAPGKTQRTIGLVIGGAGVVGMITGVITGFIAKSDYDDAARSCGVADGSAACSSNRVDQSRSAVHLANFSTISFLAGLATTGAGAIVFFTAPKSKTGPVVGVAPAAEGAGLSIAGRF